MKTYLINQTTFGLAGACFLSLIVTGSLAQEGDPFLKDKKKHAQIEILSEGNRAPGNLLTQIEYIEVPKDKATAYASDPGFLADGTALRREVQKWIVDGSASILEVGLISTRSGQRAKVESVRELIYPTEWSKDTGIPVAFETHNTGTMIEVDPISSPDGSIVDLNVAPELSAHVGESPASQRPSWFQDGDVSIPHFQSMKLSSAVTSVGGGYVLLDVRPARENGDSRSVLSFVRAAVTAGALLEENSEPIESYGVHVTAEWFEVPTVEIGKWLFEQELGKVSTSAYSVAKDWQQKGLASVANLASIQTRSGQRCKSESISEVIYATEYSPSKGMPEAFETRNQGSTVEIDPVSGPAGVDVNVSAELVKLVGNSVSYRSDKKPTVTMPIFYSVQTTTAVSVQPGVPTLVGIMTPAGEDGKPERSRKLLLFISARR
ncbi:MAG: hypothetical protein ACI9R3_005517 [Verrucomicrobiales bacterium]|jgi:hypothetical protein